MHTFTPPFNVYNPIRLRAPPAPHTHSPGLKHPFPPVHTPGLCTHLPPAHTPGLGTPLPPAHTPGLDLCTHQNPHPHSLLQVLPLLKERQRVAAAGLGKAAPPAPAAFKELHFLPGLADLANASRYGSALHLAGCSRNGGCSRCGLALRIAGCSRCGSAIHIAGAGRPS